MTRIAFYAPMKSPNHPVPSGDREMARSIMAALEDEHRGTRVELISELRCYDGKGDPAIQDKLFATAEEEVSRLLSLDRWDAWVTYHSYYKAPDLLGPRIAKALGIPYLQIEATRAAKRFSGPWDRFARVADKSCDLADAIFYLTELDGEGLLPYQRQGQSIVHLRPFLLRETLPEPNMGHSILCVGMMRPGDKLASYRIVADALVNLPGDWTCEIAGDGTARSEVEALFHPFGDRVRFLGQLDAEAIQKAYGRARVMLWPGVNEAFGMVYLEAQAAGVPVVAQDRPGVRDVVPRSGLVPKSDPAMLANAVAKLLHDDELWQTRSQQAQYLIGERHLIGAARNTIWAVLEPLLEG